jgi:hypothetical protein
MVDKRWTGKPTGNHAARIEELEKAAEYPVWLIVGYADGREILRNCVNVGDAVYTDTSPDNQGNPDSKLVLANMGCYRQPLAKFGEVIKLSGKPWHHGHGLVSISCIIKEC